MSSQPKPFITPEEYLISDAKAEIRSEYFNGEMFAMSGGTHNLARLIFNITGVLFNRIQDGRCFGASSGQRLMTPTGLFTYPDLAIICGDAELYELDPQTLLNPTILVEVLSPSTEPYNRGDKARHFRSIPSLRDYLLVTADSMCVEQYTRQDQHRWTYREYSQPTDSISIPSIGCELPLSIIYRGLKLTER